METKEREKRVIESSEKASKLQINATKIIGNSGRLKLSYGIRRNTVPITAIQKHYQEKK